MRERFEKYGDLTHKSVTLNCRACIEIGEIVTEEIIKQKALGFQLLTSLSYSGDTTAWAVLIFEKSPEVVENK